MYEVKIKNLPKSETEIQVVLPADFLLSAREKAIKMFCASLEISGFRKGHVPENVAVGKIGEAKILEEATDILLKEHFHKIIGQEKLDIIGQPKISITKLALGNPVEFKAVFAVIPSFELPDYREAAKEIAAKLTSTETTASEKEVEDVLLQIRKNKAHFDWHQAHKQNEANEEHSPARTADAVQSGGHPELNLDKEENLPVLDDELAKAAGNFKDLNELKEKVKENIITEKKIRNTEKKRASIMEELVKKTKMDLPEILIESEIEKSLAQMKDDVERTGSKFTDYLTHIKKNEEDIKKGLRENSEKKAKIQLIFNKIAEVEKLEPNKEILENEVKDVLKHYPNASETSARIYVATILLNSEVLKLLEKN
ncbi:MAG: hypothetical protein A3E02_01900 [Candidatus Zambryskibacteria bacterium RIFCSPHIGHO2_12_FULL_38_34]|uniref:Trigger factor n=1 Tax=Candidatus Zambryskibacteria bacterium RIFCSPLOWO2_12_FULL_39_16 TaxID=1802775 RepID=A0A1G2URQ0_9BACT|nr:MAG: hypothetical protein A3E02_01900 [Candidatus Zambryskibacteria bacterium RIFCSPHIGHO2_12_FULL_38_34]OHB08003.1 MAG: hypothetical protein A3I19_00420 [Candidatus Zambryskibacteria bacterium RIFCSPLOWO2_02_FULL_38_13]OHB12067.1 MAG: hypothetical protein A3G46_02730 [Candidatus Zambryskibacteria bacterium RIFCSPLOWO2_12_FULL_39_16]